MKSLDNILRQLVKKVKHIYKIVKEGMGKMRNDKPYFKLRQQLFALGMTQEELCREIGKGQQYMSYRLNGKKSFTVDEAYMILDLLDVPEDQLTEFFPKGGRTKID